MAIIFPHYSSNYKLILNYNICEANAPEEALLRLSLKCLVAEKYHENQKYLFNKSSKFLNHHKKVYIRIEIIINNLAGL